MSVEASERFLEIQREIYRHGYDRGRADAIDECINTIVSIQSQIALNEPYDEHLFTVMANRQNEIIDMLKQLKEKKGE